MSTISQQVCIDIQTHENYKIEPSICDQLGDRAIHILNYIPDTYTSLDLVLFKIPCINSIQIEWSDDNKNKWIMLEIFYDFECDISLVINGEESVYSYKQDQVEEVINKLLELIKL